MIKTQELTTFDEVNLFLITPQTGWAWTTACVRC